MFKSVLTILGILFSFQFFGQDTFSDIIKEFIQYESGNYLFQNLTIVDGTGGPVLTDQDIWIQENKIRMVGKDMEVPEGAEAIDMSNHSIIPGFIMLHEHLFYPSSTPDPVYALNQMSYSFPRLYLAGGVTTMRTAGSIMPQADVNLKKAIHSGLILGPEIDVTSPHLDRAGLNIFELTNFKNTEDAVKAVNFYADMGVTSFKVYNLLTSADLKAVVETAHDKNMKVTGHLCSITYRKAADLGIDNIEHGFAFASDLIEDKEDDQCDPFRLSQAFMKTPIDAKVYEDLIAHLVEKEVAITSTINVFEPYTRREVLPGGGLESLSPMTRDKIYQRWVSKQNRDSLDYVKFRKLMALDKKFFEAGGLLVAGTDPTYDGRIVAGFANMRILELFVEAGFSIPQAVRICTLNGAIYLEKDKETGSIAEGKNADFILMAGDISQDISKIRSKKIVFKNGIGFDSEKIFKATQGYVGIR